MKNMRFVVARRRMNQRKGLSNFLQSLSTSSGLTLSSAAILEPEESVIAEMALLKVVNDGVKSGELKRNSGLTNAQLEKEWALTIARLLDDTLVVLLVNHADFCFSVEGRQLQNTSAEQLLRFDRDSLYVATQDLRTGFGADIYTENGDIEKFEVDTWGDV